jgi:hypothetical protein
MVKFATARTHGGNPYGGCSGCAHLQPPTMCACCGESTAIVLAADNHHLPLCMRCYGVLLSVREVAATNKDKHKPKKQAKQVRQLKRKTA